MSLFRKATNQQAYFKAGLFGFEGSGKTYTAAQIAIGLHQHIKSKKPVSFFDTETGSDYVLPLFQKAGVELQVVKSRALKTLKEAIEEAVQTSDIMLLDSMTHPYRELCDTYVKKKKDGTSFIRIQDWGIIKRIWSDSFSTPYVNSRLHFIWCARAKNLFEDVEDVAAQAETGKQFFNSHKVGTAARAETESSYEPSILVEMTKEMLGDGGKYVRRATVIKDRFNVIDSKSFDNPVFKDFLPHIKLLNLGGDHLGVSEETSDAMFDGGDQDVAAMRRRRTQAYESIENSLAITFPGGTGKDKQARWAILAELTGSTSESQIQAMAPPVLEKVSRAIDRLGREILEGYQYGDLIVLKKKVRMLFDKDSDAVELAPSPYADTEAWHAQVREWEQQAEQFKAVKFEMANWLAGRKVKELHGADRDTFAAAWEASGRKA